jgi:hypothetical protein
MILSGVAIIILSPILLIVAILVKTKLGSPVIFKQERPGLNEKIFKMYKFRSMTDAKDENGELLPDEERLTSFGKKLRSTSLDELPELFNIFKGDMSIVGPRPLLVQYLSYNDSKSRLSCFLFILPSIFFPYYIGRHSNCYHIIWNLSDDHCSCSYSCMFSYFYPLNNFCSSS